MLTVINTPTVIESVGNKPKRIEEYVGRINSDTESLSIAKMVSAAGWEEPGQTPEFDEYNLVLAGMLRFEMLDGIQDVFAGQAVIAPAATRIKSMKKIWQLVMVMVVSLPIIASGADFNYSHYESLLKRHVKTGVSINSIQLNAVDYNALAREAKQSNSDYSILLKELASFDTASLKSREEKTAFWVNVYNIGAMKTIVDNYPVDSIRSRKINWLGQPWSRKVISVGGKEYSLAEIENDILLDGFKDLRIHFGINCASVSCADLLAVPYRAATLFAQLEEQGRKLLTDRKKGLVIDRARNTVLLSQIFKFDKKHFDAVGGALIFVKPYLSAADRATIDAGGLKLDYLDYDWNANDAKNAR